MSYISIYSVQISRQSVRFLSFLRTATAIKTSNKFVAAFFVIVSIALGLWIAEGPLDLLPIAGSVLGTIAVFLLKGIQMRIAFIIGDISGWPNNIIVG